ncbi:MerR family transcriptional regulator [Actinomadura sp. NAK00032]|uniref:MerR family transcriptional regulator n=1 Tax=Actinomadura sp. NAK00032 TaxID=2742128 RepID=UPI0020C75EFC|nr:MerR family transcriptional regulator [Actinomadura sp. NAK00032]
MLIAFRFARLCRLSIKQLRHYGELGLPAPAHVDADTGYRYYRPEQAREALLIGLLRSPDVPLAEVGRVLAGQDGVLAGVRARMEADIARRRRTLAALDRVLGDGLPQADVTLTREPARRVVMVRKAADQADIGAAIRSARPDVRPWRTAGRPPDGRASLRIAVGYLRTGKRLARAVPAHQRPRPRVSPALTRASPMTSTA